MILIDTSVWIEILKKNSTIKPKPEDYYAFATCSPVLQELMQGVRDSRQYASFQKDLLSFTCVGDPLSTYTFVHAADIYRACRKIGLTIRSSIDCLIAAIAIEQNLPVWHLDRDFHHIQKVSDLEIFVPPKQWVLVQR